MLRSVVRIISGEKRGFKLKTVSAAGMRPVPDRIKEALFSILGEFAGHETVLDLFAGSGSFGLEALSRGARFAFFIELNRKVYQCLQENIKKLGYENRSRSLCMDAFRFLRKSDLSFDLVFVAPPQFKDLAFKAVTEIFSRPGLVKQGGVLIVQIDKRELMNIEPVYFLLENERVYGDTKILIYRRL